MLTSLEEADKELSKLDGETEHLQYQLEERAQIYRRMRIARVRLNNFLEVMEEDTISTPEASR